MARIAPDLTTQLGLKVTPLLVTAGAEINYKWDDSLEQRAETISEIVKQIILNGEKVSKIEIPASTGKIYIEYYPD